MLLLILICIFLIWVCCYKVENFSPNADCSIQCRVQDGSVEDPQNCCECRTSGGYVTGPANDFNDPFRKCMCSFGTGYESYCMKLNTNFLLSQ